MADTIAKFRDIFGQIDSCSPLTDSIVQTYKEDPLLQGYIFGKVSPKACGHTQGRKVVSREEAVMRIKAAVDARKESGSDIVIVARSDSHQADSMQESLWRGKDAHTKSKVLDIIHFPCLGCLSEQCSSKYRLFQLLTISHSLESAGSLTRMIDDEERKDACFGGSISREWKPKLLILILLTHCLLIKEESFGLEIMLVMKARSILAKALRFSRGNGYVCQILALLEAWAQMEMQQKNNLAARQLFEDLLNWNIYFTPISHC
ncbi:hypothetical protein F8388_004256 [Cannabis sativa]|uniref:Uncharacterized protein n=1 Tax=Cannabis sativa TaxID=3483 RepID=A0A7J6IBJ9_CANSA|nr:hypothetical protein F8388_004256 [Cannabis sativa]KAF4404020.1 hypothetical protein G4B88_014476 [Cannabis sativa]